MLTDMDAHNRVLGCVVAAAEAAQKPAHMMPMLDHRPPVGSASHTDRLQSCRDHALHLLSVSVHVEPSPAAQPTTVGKENVLDAKRTPNTPKAALRKRLLEAREALGGVRLGAAPKRSISFHPHTRKGVCDDDLA